MSDGTPRKVGEFQVAEWTAAPLGSLRSAITFLLFFGGVGGGGGEEGNFPFRAHLFS